METETRSRRIPEDTLLEILARLPFRSITRFKSVSKTWKLVTESTYFRRLFISLHRNSSLSWSLMFQTNFLHPITEALGFYGCKTWDLPKSLGSYVMPFQPYPNLDAFDYSYLASSNGLIWIGVYIENDKRKSNFVGNPVLRQWVEIPPPPEPCTPTGLVTRVDEDGLVSSFKVVRTCYSSKDSDTYAWRVYVYSSETGLWTFKRLVSSHYLLYPECAFPMNLNGMVYIWQRGVNSSSTLIAHDFYSHEEVDDQCRVIHLPPNDMAYGIDVRRCLTTSGGYVVYIEILDRSLKVWRLNNNNNYESNEWLREEIDMASVGFDIDCFPMAMNPFDTDIVYLWSGQHMLWVSCNLKTQKFIVLQESENCGSSEVCYRANIHDSKRYLKAMHGSSKVFMLSHFVLPQWMNSVPTIRQIDHPT